MKHKMSRNRRVRLYSIVIIMEVMGSGYALHAMGQDIDKPVDTKPLDMAVERSSGDIPNQNPSPVSPTLAMPMMGSGEISQPISKPVEPTSDQQKSDKNANKELGQQSVVSEPKEGANPPSNGNALVGGSVEIPKSAPQGPDESTLKTQEALSEKQEQAVPQKSSPLMEEEGIDTLEQEGGNWLLKRQALEKTMDVIEKIKDLFTKTLESRIDFLVKRNTTDRAFDAFANKIGFELGDLSQLLSTLLDQLKQERKEEGDLTEEERELLTDIENKIDELKSLKTTLKSIGDMDASLDDAIMQVEKEINTSNSYQMRAWRNFQTIKKVLSDEKAEELYLQTESLLKNMQDIATYLKGELLTYFNSIIQTLQQDMEKAEAAINVLEEKGINLREEVNKVRKAEKLKRKNKMQQEEQKKEEVIKTVEVQKGWFESFDVLWEYPLHLVTTVWDYVISFFGYGTAQVKVG